MKKYAYFGICLGFVIVVVILVVFTNYMLVSPSPFGMKIAINNEWISFYGSFLGGLIGGLITLSGVFLTIKYSEQRNKNQDRLKLLPYLRIKQIAKIEETKSSIIEHVISGRNEEEGNEGNIEVNFMMRNVGLGNCINIRLKQISIKNILIWESNQESNIAVVVNDIIFFRIKLLKDLFRCDKSFETVKSANESKEIEIIPLKLEFSFQDLLGNIYLQGVNMKVFLTYPLQFKVDSETVSAPFFIEPK